MALHLFQFRDNGFFVARDKARAFELVMEHTGCDAEDLGLEEDYRCQVPNEEEINVGNEDSWGDPRETSKIETSWNGKPFTLWFLKMTAHEWVEREGEEGYVFGGEE